MRVRLAAIALAAFCAATPALAGGNFQAYEGKDAVQEGRGGTKMTSDGVDFWTSGQPPHRYQVLGVLTDRRGTGAFSGSVFGSGTARQIRKLGGDAAIVLGSSTQVNGAMMLQNGMVAVARRNTTQMMVVKYLD